MKMAATKTRTSERSISASKTLDEKENEEKPCNIENKRLAKPAQEATNLQ